MLSNLQFLDFKEKICTLYEKCDFRTAIGPKILETTFGNHIQKPNAARVLSFVALTEFVKSKDDSEPIHSFYCCIV